MKQILDTDLHWLAGLIEGEGSFFIGSPSTLNKPYISFEMTDTDITERAGKILGVKSTAIRDSRYARNGWKPCFRVRVTGDPSIQLMKLMRPLMGLRRQAQIDRTVATYTKDNRYLLPSDRVEELRHRLQTGENVLLLVQEFGVSKSYAYALRSGYEHKQRGYGVTVAYDPSKVLVFGFESRYPLNYESYTLTSQPCTFHWLAGLLEGEGSFMAPSPSDPTIPKISISMSDEDVIARVAALFNVKYTRVKLKKADAKLQYVARLRGTPAHDVMRELYPLMGNRRKSQIDRALHNYQPNPLRKHTVEQVIEVKKRLAEKQKIGEISETMQVSYDFVREIARGNTWRHVRIDNS